MTEGAVSLAAVASVLRSAGLLRDARGTGDVALRGVCQDSRRVARGDLFLAWKGTEFDAHDYVGDAARAGAVAAVVERLVPEADLSQLVVSQGRRAGALAADRVLGSPWARLWIAGVTGTNGKTTTTLIARHLLAARGGAAAVGTLGLVGADGVIRPGTEGLTTPGPVQVSSWLRDLLREGVHSVTLEASSHALEQYRLDGVGFDVAVFTNLTQDHLDYHLDFEEYRRAKLRLLALLKDDGAVVVNAESAAWKDLPAGHHGVWTYGVEGPARVRAHDVTLNGVGSAFTLEVDGVRARVRLPLVGRYNVENALAAAAIATLAGCPVDRIAGRLETVTQVTGRLEAVLDHPFRVVIDFAHTPDALRGALEAVRASTRGRLIVVFGAGGDRDRTKRRPMAEAARRLADVVVLTSDNPRTEDPERILDDLAEGLEGVPYDRIVDRRSAICRAIEMAREDDTILLAGKGHETYQVVGTEKRPFDERRVVRDCLAELGVA